MKMKRMVAVVGLLGVLVTAGCQRPDGSTDWGNTLLLGAGVGAAGAVVGGAVNDNNNRPASRGYGYHRQPRYQPQHGGYYRQPRYQPQHGGYYPGYDQYGRRLW